MRCNDMGTKVGGDEGKAAGCTNRVQPTTLTLCFYLQLISLLETDVMLELAGVQAPKLTCLPLLPLIG